ncbi:MAG: hypothetical protein LBE51_05820 [Acidovorax sp.]|jgi:cytidine deaminase|nr:hypothetical protein [Acidovorax sp.]MDR3005572.1 hypothetical protein [Acidovorax sp.]
MFTELIAAAHAVAKPLDLTNGGQAASVGAALLGSDRQIYTGVCIDMACGIGFCAEASAMAEMLKRHATRIEAAVAVNAQGQVLSPCGRCREMMLQLDPANAATRVALPGGRELSLAQLMPHHWLQDA